MLTLHVEDVLLLGKDLTMLRRIKRNLVRRFSMAHMVDTCHLCLRWALPVTGEKETVTISQCQYTKSNL